MKILGVLLAASVPLLCPASFAEPYTHAASKITFPDRLAGAEKGEVTDFEKDTPGLGTSVGYNAPGITITLYVYTMNMASVPSDPATAALKDHFAQVVGDVERTGDLGHYRNVRKLSQNVVPLGASTNAPMALTARFSYTQSGVRRLSHLYLAGVNNHFLKVRFTYNEEVQTKALDILQSLTTELAGMIEAAGGQRKTAKPGPPESGKTR